MAEKLARGQVVFSEATIGLLDGGTEALLAFAVLFFR
jgi:hypothetical protein